MGVYIKATKIRLPFPEELIKILKVSSCWDCEDYLKKAFGPYWRDPLKRKGFEIEQQKEKYYLDYIVACDFNSCVGSYGYFISLTNEELKKYVPLFNLLEIPYEEKELKKIEYCYYSSSESPI